MRCDVTLLEMHEREHERAGQAPAPDDVFAKFAQAPEKPVSVPPDQIDQNREQWIDAWTKAVLR